MKLKAEKFYVYQNGKLVASICAFSICEAYDSICCNLPETSRIVVRNLAETVVLSVERRKGK